MATTDVPERWGAMGAQALYDLDSWLTSRPLDRYPGDAEHVQAHAVLSAVLADLRRQVEALPTYVVGEFDLTVSRFDVLDLLGTGGSDGYRCPVADPTVTFPCPYRESGGYQCERLDAHGEDEHWWSEHTIWHAIAGNGYACSAFPTGGA